MPSPHQPHGDDPSVRDGYIRVRDAREHNLQGVDVDIPRDVVAVFTGVSGSGKSSLAFGTIYAEAQRRYFESVAPYARRLIHQVGAPKVGGITGLPPAVSLQQRRSAPTSRSSVGTITNLSNSLRMLFSRAGDYPPGAEHLDSDAFSPTRRPGPAPSATGWARSTAPPRSRWYRTRRCRSVRARSPPGRAPGRARTCGTSSTRSVTTSTSRGGSCPPGSGSGSCSRTSSRW